MNKIDEIIYGMQSAPLPSKYWIASNTELPELRANRLTLQRDSQSVWQHTMLVIDLLTIKNPITLLSGLFHDLGKYYVHNTDDPLLPRFPGHAIKSAKIAKTRLTTWGATPYVIDRVVRIITTHMYDIKDITQEKTIRKFVANVGLDNIGNWFTVRRADSASYSDHNRYKRHIIDPFYKRVKEHIKELSPKDYTLQYLHKQNTIMGGKDCKDDDVPLSMEGG